MNTDLSEKVVWITGGAVGLGRSLALGFASEGCGHRVQLPPVQERGDRGPKRV